MRTQLRQYAHQYTLWRYTRCSPLRAIIFQIERYRNTRLSSFQWNLRSWHENIVSVRDIGYNTREMLQELSPSGDVFKPIINYGLKDGTLLWRGVDFLCRRLPRRAYDQMIQN